MRKWAQRLSDGRGQAGSVVLGEKAERAGEALAHLALSSCG